MLWFGGFSGSGPAPHAPVGALPMWPAIKDCWLLGDWPAHEVRTALTGYRGVAVIGPCGAPAGAVAALATHGVPDDVLWRWPGSYVVVQVTAWDTVLWTDLGGALPLYTLVTRTGTYWASSSRALAALTNHRLDEHLLAASLLAPEAPALTGTRSAFADICLVPAAHRAHIPVSGQVEQLRTWHPQPVEADHAARLRQELCAAVTVRVEPASTPTADLSGGYDSTSLALLAAERLNPGRSVIGVTVHPDGVTEGGDLTYARSAAAHHPGVDHRLMPLTADQVPYSALDDLPVTDEPAPSTVAHTRFAAQLRWMRDELGSDCHLTGDGGDALLTAPLSMFADLVAHRRHRRALRETIAWARLRRVAAWPLLMDAIRTAHTRPASALHAWVQTLRTDPRRISQTPPAGTWSLPTTPPPAWVTRRTRDLAADLAADIANRDTRARGDVDTAELIAEVMHTVGRTARADIQLAEQHGIALHNPFLDSRVIDTYLAVPLDARPGPAQFKPLLRDAMRDLFPPILTARTTKGTFTSDYYGGIRTNLPALLILANGHLAAAGFVDPAAFRQTLSLAAAGIADAFTSVQHVVATEAWLRALDTATPVAWEPVAPNQTQGGAA